MIPEPAPAQFVFDGKDDYNWKSIEFDNLGADQMGQQIVKGGGLDFVDGTNDYDNTPGTSGNIWVRVTSDKTGNWAVDGETQGSELKTNAPDHSPWVLFVGVHKVRPE